MQKSTIKLAVAAVLLSVAAAVAAQQKPTKSPGVFRNVGQFKVWAATVDFVYKGSNLALDFRAKPGQKVKAQSPRYDFAAPRIQMAFGNKTSQIQNAQATGGVTGEAREPEREQVIVFSANRADYKEPTNANPARIDLTGDVKLTYKNPKFSAADPPTFVGESGTLFLLPDGTIKGTLNSGVFTGTALEPDNEKKP